MTGWLRRLQFCVSAILLLAVPMTAPDAARAAEREYLLATASPGGTFYPVGVALATLVNVQLQQSRGVTLTAVTTAGSAENVRMMRSGGTHFAILQGLFGYDARAGTGLFAGNAPDDSLRSVTALWPNVEQFVLRSEFVDTGTVDDLARVKGVRIVLGNTNSGTLASSSTLLGNLGFDVEQDFELVYLGYGPAADALQGGDVAAAAMPAGLPTKSVTRLKSAMGDAAAILSFTPDQARRADNGRMLWQPYRIPANTYPGQAEDIMSIAQPNFLAVRADAAEEDVYLIIKAIYENLPVLHSMHSATQTMSIETALSGLPMPLHPGAARYFREAGLQIPEHLLAR